MDYFDCFQITTCFNFEIKRFSENCQCKIVLLKELVTMDLFIKKLDNQETEELSFSHSVCIFALYSAS